MIDNAELVKILPALRAFARKLVRRDKDRSEDLLQDTVLRMLDRQDQFYGGNLRGWGFKVMFNIFSHSRRRKDFAREAIEIDDRAAIFSRPPEQDARMKVLDLDRRWLEVPPRPRAMLLLYAGGDSYEEIAAAMHMPLGSIKSSISRARQTLQRP